MTAKPRQLAPRSRHHKGQAKIGTVPNRYNADGTRATAKQKMARIEAQIGRPHKPKGQRP